MKTMGAPSRSHAARRLVVVVSLAVAGMFVGPPPSSAAVPVPRDLAEQSAPLWHFARALKRDTCWPSAAVDGADRQVPGAQLKAFPTAGQGGCPSKGSPFPAYITTKRCTANEIRVGYTLYFAKDGFSGLGGHVHDFESVVVVWTQVGGAWGPRQLLMTRHGDIYRVPWSGVESDNGVQPKVYVGWSKHAMFNTRGGTPAGVLNSEFRSNNYWQTASTLLEVRRLSNGLGRNHLAALFDRYSWGSASTTPSVVAQKLCRL